MRGKVSIIAVVLMLATGSSLAMAQARKLDTLIRDYAKEHNFNGTILIQNKGKEIYQKSFGVADRAFNVPIDNGTRYKIASITKAFTAVLILQLYEQGKLDLHRTIKTYLPDYAGEAAERVTIHHLLNHTSGMQNMDNIGSAGEAIKNGLDQYQLPHTIDQLLTRYCSGKLVHEPGKVYDYDNAEYIILGKIIERLTGETYAEALKERILMPLGMQDSGLLYQYNIVKNLANTYFSRDDLKRLANDLPVYIENWYAAGAIYSTADDLLKFSNALFGCKLIKQETLSLMLKPGLDEYGYGVWIRTVQVRGKQYRGMERPGRIMGANVLLFHFLDNDLTIIVLSNTDLTPIGVPLATLLAGTIIN
jgi:D-alanyl-D-alanine carboxypeptidase